jgi:hypothetical protein
MIIYILIAFKCHLNLAVSFITRNRMLYKVKMSLYLTKHHIIVIKTCLA